MTDHEKLLVALWREEDRDVSGEVSVLDVIAMLSALGREHRRVVLAGGGSRYPVGPSRASRSAA